MVLYGGNSNWFAAYAYWYFRFYGHRAVRLLDGGRKTWELEGRPLTTEVPEPAPGHGYRVGGRRRGSLKPAAGAGTPVLERWTTPCGTASTPSPRAPAPPPAGARHPFPESMVITTLPTLRPVSTYR